MQTQVASSTTESKYIILSLALREVIYLQQVIREMRRHGLEFEETEAKVHCKTFEDNSGASEIANIHKLRPRTKHLLAVSWHHCRHHVMNGDITVIPIGTEDQLADCITKSTDFQTLKHRRYAILDW